MAINRVDGVGVAPQQFTQQYGKNYTYAPNIESVMQGDAALKRGMAGDSIKELQQKLNAMGANLDVDGKFGPKTEAALKKFQASQGLAADGQAGPRTFAALDSGFTPGPKPKPNPAPPNQQGPSGPSGPSNVTPGPSTGAAGQYEAIALKKHGQEFVDKAKGIAQRLGVKPEWLFGIMQNESGMDPKAFNKNGGATGVIQFMPATAKALGTTTEALSQMSATQQLDYVEKFYKPYAGKLDSGAAMYLATFYPLALSKGNDFVIGSERSDSMVHTIARQNPAFDVNKDGQITKQEFYDYYNKRFPGMAS